MLVYPAASELNTQPVHKIPFINALSLPDAFHLKFLAFDHRRLRLSLCRFSFTYFVSTYFVRCTSDALRLVSFVVILFFRLASLAERRSRCLACNNFASAQTHRNVSRSSLSRFASRSLCSLIRSLFSSWHYVIFFSFLSLYLCWHVYVYSYVLYLVGWMCRLVPVHCEIVLLITRNWPPAAVRTILVFARARTNISALVMPR